MGPVLGKAALLTDAVGVLLPILPVAKRGFKFLFDDKEVLIIETKSEKIVARGVVDPVEGLYVISLSELLSAFDPEGENEAKVLVARRRQRASKQVIEAVLWLHKCLGHAASFTAMARSLKCGAWRGVPLDIDDVMVKLVMDKVRCLVCMIGKTNHLARQKDPERVWWERVKLFPSMLLSKSILSRRDSSPGFI